MLEGCRIDCRMSIHIISASVEHQNVCITFWAVCLVSGNIHLVRFVQSVLFVLPPFPYGLSFAISQIVHFHSFVLSSLFAKSYAICIAPSQQAIRRIWRPSTGHPHRPSRRLPMERVRSLTLRTIHQCNHPLYEARPR